MRAATPRPHPAGSPEAWQDAIERAADQGRLAPSVHNTQPWVFALFPDRLEVRADPSRQLTVLDPDGRELVESVGAALFNVRASLAASHVPVTVDRLASVLGPLVNGPRARSMTSKVSTASSGSTGGGPPQRSQGTTSS